MLGFMRNIGSRSLSQPHRALGVRMGTFGSRVIMDSSKWGLLREEWNWKPHWCDFGLIRYITIIPYIVLMPFYTTHSLDLWTPPSSFSGQTSWEQYLKQNRIGMKAANSERISYYRVPQRSSWTWIYSAIYLTYQSNVAVNRTVIQKHSLI